MRRSKYGNRKTTIDGMVFDSKLEAACWQELRLRERAGEIKDLQRQVAIPITVNQKTVCKLVIDFQFWENGLVWLDAKGMLTPISSLKLKLARALYPDVRIELYRRGRVN